MKTSHRDSETGHTAAILEEIPAMFCDGLRCLLKLKLAGKCSFHRSVWQGLNCHQGSVKGIGKVCKLMKRCDGHVIVFNEYS